MNMDIDMGSLFSNIQQSLSGTNANANANNSTALLQKQQNTQQQINAILEQSYNSLICGPSCQRQKITKELEQKYLDAQTNLKTAPEQLNQSEKNYYIYTQGETAYNAKKEEELKANAEKIGQKLTKLFNDELTNAVTMNSYLTESNDNSEYVIELLNMYLKENAYLLSQLKESQSDIVTNDRKTYYETDATDKLGLWYILFWRAFYFLYIILFFTLISTKKFGALFASVLLVFYPYYINQLSKWVYGEWMGLINKLPSNVYNNL